MIKLFISIFILFISFIYSQNYLSVCAIFRDEAAYLKEWIEFHKLQGVEHFYLYNNLSTDNYKEVLSEYDQIVTLVEWPYDYTHVIDWGNIQCNSYMNCIARFGERSKWMAFIDSDEFLFCLDGEPLNKFLEKYESYPGIGINWICFGTSGVFDLLDNELMIEKLYKCSKTKENNILKCIVKPGEVERCPSPHFFIFKNGQSLVDEDGIPLLDGITKSHKGSKIRINHYWTRTVSYYLNQKIPRYLEWEYMPIKQFLQRQPSYEKDDDYKIQQFVPLLKTRIVKQTTL